MSNSNQSSSVRMGPSAKMIAGMAIRLLALLVLLAALLFVPAGRWDWLDAWLFIGAYGVFLALYGVWGLWKDPEQLEERSRISPNAKPWDKLILGAYTICLLIIFPLAGLDAGRFQWSAVGWLVKAVAWLGMAAAGSVIFWASATNTYLSRVARIQDDRGQKVVTAGPYRYVRHPRCTPASSSCSCASPWRWDRGGH
jgi:protein-S-isoprenylcysteine O-methyltransferase Ste14